jgi:hypothetical protein
VFDHVSLDMSKYYQQDFEGFLESFKEEVAAQVAMMKILDEEIICSNLPPVGRSKELFRMVDTLGYAADFRYKKKNNIVENDFDYVTYFKKEDMLTEMRNILREEVTNYFSHVAATAND